MTTKTHIGKTEESQKEVAVQIRSSDPVTPVQDQTWINTSTGELKFYDSGTEQVVVGPQGATGLEGPAGVDGSDGLQGVTGLAGLAGSSGSQGATGISGSTGPEGLAGPQGVTGLPLTGPAGLTGIKGDTGSQGITGLRGTTGISGNTGPIGLQGVTGGQGIQGTTGGIGVTGPSGGQQGVTGVAGATGVAGPAGGPQGSTGIKGDTGVRGFTGAQGITGLIGNTGIQGATGLPGDTGIRGVTGIAGQTGPIGATGEQGSVGVTGFPGPTGFPGVTGSRGVTGLIGPTGSAGTTGVQGVPGIGIQGTTGERGPTGPFGGPSGDTGISGSTGPRGETGRQGVPGIQGTTGLRGPTGPEGGPPGITGSPGLDGSTGPQGVTGVSGATGPYGGPQGATGQQGVTGFAGPTGVGSSGEQGQTGVKGDTGLPGTTGPRGVTGYVGHTGIQGATGILGSTGLPGDRYKGLSTSTLTIVTLSNISLTTDSLLSYTPGLPCIVAHDINNYMSGYVISYDINTGSLVVYASAASGSGTYSSWSVNISGSIGIQGVTGVAGETGILGPTGVQGETGVRGETGIQGPPLTQLQQDLDVNNFAIISNIPNGNIIVAPNGSGSLLADVPDGGYLGGNTRGNNSVDLQTSRTSSNQVASGNNSVISGGSDNKASNTYATVSGGYSNSANGIGSSVLGGVTNTASSESATVAGGSSNTSAGSNSFIGGGQQNSATNNNAAIVGGQLNTVSGNAGAIGGGNSNSVLGAHSTVPGGSNNSAMHDYSIAAGSGSSTSSDFDFVLGNNNSTPNVNNVHFRVDGINSDVHVGRQTDQTAVIGAENRLFLHTKNPSNQSKGVRVRANDSQTATYDLQLPATAGSADGLLQTDGSGNLTWSNSANNLSLNYSVTGSTSSPVHFPRMTSAQRLALVGVTTGRCVFDTTLGSLYVYNGTAWVPAGGGSTLKNIVTQVGHGFTSFDLGSPLYFDGTSYVKAQADTGSEAEVIGLLDSLVDANTFNLAMSGIVSIDSAVNGGISLVPGEVYYLSAVSAGQITVTEPSVVGQISKPLGIAISTNSLEFINMRGYVVGSSNVRTQISLANNSTTTVQNASAYEAGELSGWIAISATTPLKFYTKAQFSRNGAGSFNISYQTSGDTPPVGFLLQITPAGLIQAVLPAIAGFGSASITYGLDVAAVGTSYPLSVPASGIVWSEPVAFRNKIINGNFDIWQRGTSFSVTANNTYTADRWAYVFSGAGATRTVSRQNFAINQTEVSGAPKYFINSTQSVAGTGGTFNALVQRIESVRTFAGQTVTISFWAKSSAGSFVVVGLGQRASTNVFNTITSANLTSTWTKYTGTITLPAIASGVTEDGNDHLEVAFNFANNATHNIDIAQVQLEAGSIATPLEQRPIGTELALCQRYYQQAVGEGGSFIRAFNNGTSTGQVSLSVFLKQTMRATPSSVTGVYDISDGSPVSFSSGANANRDSFGIVITVPAGQFADLQSYTVSAEL